MTNLSQGIKTACTLRKPQVCSTSSTAAWEAKMHTPNTSFVPQASWENGNSSHRVYHSADRLSWQKVLAKVTTLLSVYMGLCKYLINSWHSCEVTMRLVSELFIEAKERSNTEMVKNLTYSLKMWGFFFFLYLILDLTVSYFLKNRSFWLLTYKWFVGKIDYCSFMMFSATEILFLFQHCLLQDSAQHSIS